MRFGIWGGVALALVLSSWCFHPAGSFTVVEGAVFSSAFLLLIKLRHNLGVGSSAILPAIIATAFTMFNMSTANVYTSMMFPLACFVRYTFLGFIMLTALALSGRKPLLKRTYNGVVSVSISWVVTGVFLSGIGPGSSISFLRVLGGLFSLGAATGAFIMVATQSKNVDSPDCESVPQG